jgi:oligopeptide transport system permease protein
MQSETHFTAADFTPAKKSTELHRISRPSLSYWQDAWLRLKKNRQAIASLWIVGLLAVFTVAGPYFWPQDPSLQILNEASLGPTLGRSAIVVPEVESWSEILVTPAAGLSHSQVQNLQIIGEPTTSSIALRWDPVPGAQGYAIYRTDRKPEGLRRMGLPLAEVKTPGQVSYRDRMNIEPRTYTYTVLPILGGEEGQGFGRISVSPKIALKLSDAQELDPNAQVGATLTLPPHPFGTDYLGRDLLARIIAGARVSLSIGFFTPILYIFLGVLIGGFAGYSGGKTDLIIMRSIDLVVALPFLLFMILFRIAFGVQAGESGIFPLLVALVVLSWPSSARLVRGQILQLREAEYVQAARLLGARTSYLLLRHLVPNTMGVILVYLTFAIPSTIFTEAFLSFIGMGVVPPTPSWGSLCNDGIQSFLSHPHEFLFPAVFISITVLAFNLLGDGLRDALDPKQRGAS